MKKFTEENTYAVLKDIPIFCLDRVYKTRRDASFQKIQYLFNLKNGATASVVEFNDWKFSGGCQYEMLGEWPDDPSRDIDRGDAGVMDDLLTELENVVTSHIIAIE
ncbi:MAG TPA: hypothetical protein VIY47_05990 [Ignavibacteriaceae bacterium]